MESLVVPEASAVEEAGKLIQDLPKLWAEANLAERRKLLLTRLDAVHLNAREEKIIAAIKLKPPFGGVYVSRPAKRAQGLSQ